MGGTASSQKKRIPHWLDDVDLKDVKQEDCERIWREYDHNRSGALEREQLATFIKEYARVHEITNAAEIEQLIVGFLKQFDRNRNGIIEWQEVVQSKNSDPPTLRAQIRKAAMAFMEACLEGDLATVQESIKQGVPLNRRVVDGSTALHLAAHGGHAQIVHLLLAHSDIDIDATDDNGWTPLHKAINKGAFDVASMLIEHRCNVRARDRWDGSTPLHIVAKKPFLAVQCARVLLIQGGANPNELDKCGQSPLYIAAANASHLLVEYLLAAGGDPMLEDFYTSRCPADYLKILAEDESKHYTPPSKKAAAAGRLDFLWDRTRYLVGVAFKSRNNRLHRELGVLDVITDYCCELRPADLELAHNEYKAKYSAVTIASMGSVRTRTGGRGNHGGGLGVEFEEGSSEGGGSREGSGRSFPELTFAALPNIPSIEETNKTSKTRTPRNVGKLASVSANRSRNASPSPSNNNNTNTNSNNNSNSNSNSNSNKTSAAGGGDFNGEIQMLNGDNDNNNNNTSNNVDNSNAFERIETIHNRESEQPRGGRKDSKLDASFNNNFMGDSTQHTGTPTHPTQRHDEEGKE